MDDNQFIDGNIELLIISYFTGSITEEDLLILNEWINTSKENRSNFNLIKDSWILAAKKNTITSAKTERSWNELSNKLTNRRTGLLLTEQRNSDFVKYLKLAASWFLIFGLGSAITWWISGRPKDEIAAATGRTIEISTPLGARSLIKMPDSSLIWLNAGTKIIYGEDYGQQTRTLLLSGEAYFTVAKDTLRPFIVRTQGIIIRALGTRFNVKAYPEENTISATLEEGKIDVRTLNMADKNKRELLLPKEKLIYYKGTDETERYSEITENKIKTDDRHGKLKDVNVISDVRTELYTSWKDSRWIIDGEPLSTLAPMLERRFNLKIIFDDEQLKKLKFTGSIENETVDQILKAIKLTAPIDFQINKDTLRLKLDNESKEKFKKIMTRNN